MKTIIIWDGDEICFFVLDGDYSKFDNIYIGIKDYREDLQKELNDLIFDYDVEGASFKHKELQDFPVHEFYGITTKDDFKVIVAGQVF